jgi:hypothetical protein
MEKYKFNKKLLSKRIYILITVTFIVFTYRNFLRIQNEIVTYKYKPLKEFIYSIDNKNFNLHNNLNDLIINYELCKNLKKDCNLEVDKSITVKKKYGKYVFYKKND